MTKKTVAKKKEGHPFVYSLQDLIRAAQTVLALANDDQNYVPTDSKVCLIIGTSRQTLYRRITEAKANPLQDQIELMMLCDTLDQIETLQRDRLMSNGLTEKWNSGFAKFLLSANHNIRESTVQENLNVDINAAAKQQDNNDSTTAIRDALAKLSGANTSSE